MADAMRVFRGARDACTAFSVAMSHVGTFCTGEPLTRQGLHDMTAQLDQLCNTDAAMHYKQLCLLLLDASESHASQTTRDRLQAHTEALMRQLE